MGYLQLSDHVVQNLQTGEQMTHWDMLNKATKFEFSLFYMSHCVICSPVWSFLYHVIALLQMAHLILPTLRENGTNIVKASRFLLAATIGRLFDSHFSLVDFSALK